MLADIERMLNLMTRGVFAISASDCHIIKGNTKSTATNGLPATGWHRIGKKASGEGTRNDPESLRIGLRERSSQGRRLCCVSFRRIAQRFLTVANVLGDAENNWLRQFLYLWGMCGVALCAHGMSGWRVVPKSFFVCRLSRCFYMFANVYPSCLTSPGEKLGDPELFLESQVLTGQGGPER